MNYFIFSLVGLVIDESLRYYNIILPYSFMMLFLQVGLYNIKYKKMSKDNKTFQLIIKLVSFVILPVIFSLV